MRLENKSISALFEEYLACFLFSKLLIFLFLYFTYKESILVILAFIVQIWLNGFEYANIAIQMVQLIGQNHLIPVIQNLPYYLRTTL